MTSARPEGQAQARSPVAEALAQRDFVLLLAGHWASQLGTQMLRVALAWHLYQLTGSALALGFLGLARALPILGFSLCSGVVADTRDRRSIMLVTQSLAMLVSLALAAISLLDIASPALLYLLTFVSGAVFAFDGPARQAMIPTLVPASALQGALSLNITGWQIAAVAGPALAGPLLACSTRPRPRAPAWPRW